MPANASSPSSQTNIVTNYPTLPVPLIFGNMNWSRSFEGFPSGTIEYEGVLPGDVQVLQGAYATGTKVSFYGVDFEVRSFSATKAKYVVTDVYRCTIGLRWYYERAMTLPIRASALPSATKQVVISNKIRYYREVNVVDIASKVSVPYSGPNFAFELPPDADFSYSLTLKEVLEQNARRLGCFVDYGSGIHLLDLQSAANSYNFPQGTALTGGSSGIQTPIGYKEMRVTGAFSKQLPSAQNTGATPFIYMQPSIKTIVEEDKNPHLPPPSDTKIENLDSNHDFSGPTKSKKITTTVNDTPESEEVWIYGYAYLLEDMQASQSLPVITNPQAHWRVIEYKKTTYVYQKLQPISFDIEVRDADNLNVMPHVIHPDYTQYVSISGTKMELNLPTRYLVGTKTEGYKWTRLVKENDSVPVDSLGTMENVDNSLSGPSNPYYNHFKFRQVPLSGESAYPSSVTLRVLLLIRSSEETQYQLIEVFTVKIV